MRVARHPEVQHKKDLEAQVRNQVVKTTSTTSTTTTMATKSAQKAPQQQQQLVMPSLKLRDMDEKNMHNLFLKNMAGLIEEIKNPSPCLNP